MDTDHPAERLEVVIALDDVGTAAQPEELQTILGTIVVVRVMRPAEGCDIECWRESQRGVLVLADTAQIFDRRTIRIGGTSRRFRFAAVSGALGRLAQWMDPRGDVLENGEWLRYHESRVHSSVGVTGAVYLSGAPPGPSSVGTLLDDVFVL